MQAESYFFILKNDQSKIAPTGGYHWLEYLPGFVYCFVPSKEADTGRVYAYNYMPPHIKNFLYCSEIQTVIKFQRKQ